MSIGCVRRRRSPVFSVWRNLLHESVPLLFRQRSALARFDRDRSWGAPR